MRKIKVTFEIDITNEKEMEAYSNMISALAECAPSTTKETSTVEEEKTTTAEKTEKKTDVTMDQLRSLVSEKNDKHRKAMKDKVTELGFSKLALMTEDKFEEFKIFLEALPD